MENIDTALELLVVGMVMVVIILCLVVVIGNLVIRLTNRFIPVTDEAPHQSGRGGTQKKGHAKKMAAIVAAVDVVTQGKGNIENIEKK